MKLKYVNICLLCAAMAGFSSCNDLSGPGAESAIIPESFFATDNDLAAYTVNLYNFFSCIQPGSYGISTFGSVNHTDNQAAMGYSARWVPGEWRVPIQQMMTLELMYGTSSRFVTATISSITYCLNTKKEK